MLVVADASPLILLAKLQLLHLLPALFDRIVAPVRPVLDRLGDEGAWIDEYLVRKVLEAAGEVES